MEQPHGQTERGSLADFFDGCMTISASRLAEGLTNFWGFKGDGGHGDVGLRVVAELVPVADDKRAVTVTVDVRRGNVKRAH